MTSNVVERSPELWCMEELTRRCDRLSLSAREDTRITLSKKQVTSDYVVATKFYTRRALNMEVVMRTFRPLWCTKDGFEVMNAGNNVLLFAFEREVDVEKVLLGEPWSYDRHLVVLERFDGRKPISELEFKLCSFWVQIHELPFKFMSPETAMEIGETIGPISQSYDISKMKGGSFMHVQTTIDVLVPLCQGRRIMFDDKSEGWVEFQYERLPNMCYWCGMLTHDDKDCEVWLKSKGSLSLDKQQFGPWLRAPQFSLTRRQTIEVKGFNSEPSLHRPERDGGKDRALTP